MLARDADDVRRADPLAATWRAVVLALAIAAVLGAAATGLLLDIAAGPPLDLAPFSD